MKTQKLNNEMIRPADLYEWTINNINELSTEERIQIKFNLRQLDFYKQLILRLPTHHREQLKSDILNGLKDNSMPIDLMAISCILYHLEQSKVETSDLRHEINYNERVRSYCKKSQNE